MRTLSKQRSGWILLAGLLVTACGGGSGERVSSTPPPPTPTPTPPPAPTLVPLASILPNVTQSTAFAAIGIGTEGGGAAAFHTDGFSVAYDAGIGAYVMDYPFGEPGVFHEYSGNTPSAYAWSGALVSNGVKGTNVEVLKPGNPTLQLTYTSIAGFNPYDGYNGPSGWMAFGAATESGAVPVTGSATYDALLRGADIDGMAAIDGTARFEFDFVAGSLSGYLEPGYWALGGMQGGSHSLGRYTFVDTVYSSGATNFSGEFSHPILGQAGTFNGMFTGPAAQELMARWTAPFTDPNTNVNSTMFGVLVGKR